MSRHQILFLVATAALARPLAGQTAPTNAWRNDSSHSAVTFRVRHLGITWVNGAFRRWTAELQYDPAKPEASSVTAKIQAASIDTENERRDSDVRSNYLATDSFPEITYVSRKVERIGADKLKITGDLTMRGVTKPVVLDAEIGGVVNTPRGRRTAFTATGSIKRQDFGITLNRLMEGAQVVGDEIRVTIDFEAIAAGPTG
jgi:polyisoprenoid-binding protein YceI